MGAAFDIESYEIVGDLVLRGEEVYASPTTVNRHPYLPLQMYWMAASLWGARVSGLSFVRLVRLAPIVADVAISLLIYHRLRRAGCASAAHAGLAYALSPISVLVSAYHGQFDAIPVLFILLALESLRVAPWVAGAWLGLGILDKSWPVLALPSLLAGAESWPKRIRLSIAALGFPLVGVAVYVVGFGADLTDLLQRTLSYNSGVGVWGYTYLVRLLSIVRPDTTFLFDSLVRWGRFVTLAALGLVWFIRARREPPQAGILTLLLAFIALSHGFAIQYLIWLVPFALLNEAYRWLTWYTLAAFCYMFLAYMTLILEMHITNLLPWPQADWFIIIPAGIPAWLVTVGWLVSRLRNEPQLQPGRIGGEIAHPSF